MHLTLGEKGEISGPLLLNSELRLPAAFAILHSFNNRGDITSTLKKPLQEEKITHNPPKLEEHFYFYIPPFHFVDMYNAFHRCIIICNLYPTFSSCHR